VRILAAEQETVKHIPIHLPILVLSCVILAAELDEVLGINMPVNCIQALLLLLIMVLTRLLVPLNHLPAALLDICPFCCKEGHILVFVLEIWQQLSNFWLHSVRKLILQLLHPH